MLAAVELQDVIKFVWWKTSGTKFGLHLTHF